MKITMVDFKHKVQKYEKERMAKLERDNNVSKLTMLNFKLITYKLFKENKKNCLIIFFHEFITYFF
jgi:hypothetical protein